MTAQGPQMFIFTQPNTDGVLYGAFDEMLRTYIFAKEMDRSTRVPNSLIGAMEFNSKYGRYSLNFNQARGAGEFDDTKEEVKNRTMNEELGHYLFSVLDLFTSSPSSYTSSNMEFEMQNENAKVNHVCFVSLPHQNFHLTWTQIHCWPPSEEGRPHNDAKNYSLRLVCIPTLEGEFSAFFSFLNYPLLTP